MLAEQPYASIHTLGLDPLRSGIVSMIDGLRDELNIVGDNKPDHLKNHMHFLWTYQPEEILKFPPPKRGWIIQAMRHFGNLLSLPLSPIFSKRRQFWIVL
jgi:hypothetical protein